ncbi:tumor necrosis factor receptor superfamily member 1A isoform X1 [Chanodichthys erythropterus]|uniref:tumor necrosis factor receptor superfamily member 1A isoform X1 n=1 Tax=Chanodichthys erythropterus TaxID=933992 RepID=UPI00351E72BF
MRKCQMLYTCTLLILISQSYIISISGAWNESCPEDEYLSKNGFCCNKCHAGFKLKAECPKPGMKSECVKCEDGTYLDQPNYSPNCFRCQKCKHNSKESLECTHKSNRGCECMKGYYKIKLSHTDWECYRCKTVCGPGQVKTGDCGGEQNTQCECEQNHYPAKNNKSCELCVKCQTGCKHLCISSTPMSPIKSAKPTTPSDTLPRILVPVCACITVVALGLFMSYEGLRLWRKRNRALSSQKSSPAPEGQTLIIMPPDKINESVPSTNQPCEPEQNRKLPDCVPREIKIHEFFYFVLDEVPVARFKELVRRLGVSEQNIERAEQDHRKYKDAQYQMLKVWSDSGSGGGSNVLPYHHIQMFIETLRDMYLVNCADNIENRFLSQDTSAT